MTLSYLSPVFKSPPSAHYFFGYFDKSPLDAASKRHLAMRVPFMDHVPAANDEAVIGYFDLATGNFTELATTNAFNWQQGAMLQWLGPDFNREILFNRRTANGFRAIVMDVETRRERQLDMAIYSVSRDGKYALAIDFARHYWCRRGYSYDGIVDPEKNQPIVPNDGIWLLDIEENKVRKVIDIESVLSVKPLASMKGATHYLEHIVFSPSGRQFSFYHRWKLAEGGIYARLYVASIDDGRPYLVHDTGRISHHCWVDEEHILAWGGHPTMLNRLRKSSTLVKYFIKPLIPLYKRLVKGNSISGQSAVSRIVTGDSYFVVNVKSGKLNPVFLESIDRDGHPSVLAGAGDWIVTDTYPDSKSRARLLLGNLKNDTVQILDELKSIPEYDNSPSRCDLHPKLSLDGQFVSVDTMNDGVRSVYLYKLPVQDA